MAGGAALAWAPFVRRPLSPDEAGFLLVASQWRAGRSLYGDYWVDRPPLLLVIFHVADLLGGPVGLRLIGILAVVTSVVLAAGLTRAVTGQPHAAPILVAGLFLSSPWFGTTVVNGEVLAVPLVLASALAMIKGRQCCGVAHLGWWLTAGSAAGAAMLVKQNFIDAFVVAALLVVPELARCGARRRALGQTTSFALGALLVCLVVAAYAAARGTRPGPLWNAVFTFRLHASEVIRASSTSTTSHRLLGLLIIGGLSGAPLVAATLSAQTRRPVAASDRRAPDLRWPGLVLILWECAAIAAGGSYWRHYLICLVPGLVLLAVAAAQRPETRRRTTALALVVALLTSAYAAVLQLQALGTPSTDLAVADYLRAHSTPSDSVVVAFGHPDIVYEARMTSPYPLLWSLPVRVRDPDLHQFTRVLAGRRAPTWVVVAGRSLSTWGVDVSAAEPELTDHYQPQVTIGPWVVWRLDRAAAAG